MTDLTLKRLDELEYQHALYPDSALCYTLDSLTAGELRALIAMARRTLEAERYSNRTRLDLEGMSTALALAERDRDRLRTVVEAFVDDAHHAQCRICLPLVAAANAALAVTGGDA